MTQSVSMDDTVEAQLKELGQSLSFDRLVEILESLSKVQTELRWFPQPDILLQVRCLSLIHKEPSSSEPARSESNAQSASSSFQLSSASLIAKIGCANNSGTLFINGHNI